MMMIRGYQRWVSPLLPKACRFYPTCSQYALECFSRFGFFKALKLSTFRLCRCHPYCEGGLDPVPK